MEHLTVKISFAEMKQFTLAIPIGPIASQNGPALDGGLVAFWSIDLIG
jgi:hypothetical protein